MTKKIRIREIATDLGIEIDNKDILEFLASKGITTNKEGKPLTASSNIEEEHFNIIKAKFISGKTKKPASPDVTETDAVPVKPKAKSSKVSAEKTEKKNTTPEKNTKEDSEKVEKTKKVEKKEIKVEEIKNVKAKTTSKPAQATVDKPEVKKESVKEPVELKKESKSVVAKDKKIEENSVSEVNDISQNEKKASTEKKVEEKNSKEKVEEVRTMGLAVATPKARLSVSDTIKKRMLQRTEKIKEKFSAKIDLKDKLSTHRLENSSLRKIEIKTDNKLKKTASNEISPQEPYKKKIKEMGSTEIAKENSTQQDDSQRNRPNFSDKRPYNQYQPKDAPKFEKPATTPAEVPGAAPTGDKKGKDNKKDKKGKDDYKKKQLAEEERLLAKAMTGKKKKKDDRKSDEFVEENLSKEVEIYDGMTVKDIAEKLRLKETDIIRDLFMKGVMITVNQALDKEMITKIVIEKGFTVKEDTSKQDEMLEMKLEEMAQDESSLVIRPPVVTIMGHVDHGKTSLLDSIRKTKVTAGEAGGITQHIGAYQVLEHGRPITFLDTPGHEAFTALRARGAKATDIAVLVVAADDGVMPQTIEAIHHAKAASVPIIVAINKMDKPDANPDRVKQQLAEHELVPEDWGGTTVMVPVSARAKMGIDDLLEMILLTADIQEFRSNPNKLAQGVIIESKLDKGKGAVATVLIQAGTLKVGDNFVVGAIYGKVRAMFNYLGHTIKEATPSTPVQVIGYSGVPVAGELFKVVATDKEAKEIAEKTMLLEREKASAPARVLNLENISEQIAKGIAKELNIVIKADAQGSCEALEQSLSKVSVEDVKLRVIHSGIGDVTESDISLAAASRGIVIAFNTKADAKTKDLAEKESIDIRSYNIIYRVIEDIQKALEGMLEPEYEEVKVGKVEIRAIFTIGKNVIAGCYVIEGKVARNATLKVFRGNQLIHTGKIDALKRFKDDAKEVLTGFECGISLEKFNELQQGDIFEVYVMQEKTR